MSIFNDKIHDLCSRTYQNLQFIEDAKAKGFNVFEITQLINSMLGIIVNIAENDFKSENFERITINRTTKEVWGIPESNTDSNLSVFLVHLRNSIAHINLEYEDKGSGEIKRIIFRNYTDNSKEYETWCCRFAVSKLRIFIYKLIDYIENN